MEEVILALQKENSQLRESNAILQSTADHLKIRVEQLLRLLYGKKSEKLPAQNPDLFTGLLFAEEENAVIEPAVEIKPVAAPEFRVLTPKLKNFI